MTSDAMNLIWVPYVKIGDDDWTYEEMEELFNKMCDGWTGFTCAEAEAVVLARMSYMVGDERPYIRTSDGTGEMRNVMVGLAGQCKKLVQEKYEAEHELRLVRHYKDQHVRRLEWDVDSVIRQNGEFKSQVNALRRGLETARRELAESMANRVPGIEVRASEPEEDIKIGLTDPD